MFADRIIEWGRGAKGHYEAVTRVYGAKVTAAMAATVVGVEQPATQRFALSPEIAELTARLAFGEKSLSKLAKGVVLPDELTWIEWPVHSNGVFAIEGEEYEDSGHRVRVNDPKTGKVSERKLRKVGMFLCGFEVLKGEPAIHAADVTVCVLTEFDEVGFSTYFRLYFRNGEIDFEVGLENRAKKDVPTYAAFAAAACAVINTPRIFDHKPSDLEKLNKARAKKGKAALLEYSEVTMPHETAEVIREASFGDPDQVPEHKKGARKRHRVKTFVRIREGIIQFVKPHWRGDRRLGYAQSSVMVKHQDERVPRDGTRRTVIR